MKSSMWRSCFCAYSRIARRWLLTSCCGVETPNSLPCVFLHEWCRYPMLPTCSSSSSTPCTGTGNVICTVEASPTARSRTCWPARKSLVGFEQTPDGRGTEHDTFGVWTGGGATGSADSRRVVCEVRCAARRVVAGQGAFVQAVRRLDTAVAEDIEHAPAVEGGAGCAGERRSNAETIAVKPDDFPSSRFAGSRDDTKRLTSREQGARRSRLLTTWRQPITNGSARRLAARRGTRCVCPGPQVARTRPSSSIQCNRTAS